MHAILFISIFIFLSISLFVFEPKIVVLGSKSLHTNQTHIALKNNHAYGIFKKFLVGSNFWIIGKMLFFVFKILGCYNPSPLKQNLVPRFKKKLGT